jgi:NAD(P)-dependent dehydrogenase (short-subunit alcohol dehydrogenase family)
VSVVIVSGGTWGIGKSIAVVLAESGHRVVTFGPESRQPTSIAENGGALLREEAGRRNLPIEVFEADVSVAADVARIVDRTLADHGRVDALVNNAAIGPLGTILETPEDLWDRVVDVNLKGMYLTCKAVLPAMIRQGGGSIVNVGSGAGWGKPNMFAYASSKGGVFAPSTALAYDFFNQRIRVNVVVPGGGGIPTGMSVGRAGGDMERLTRDARGSAAGRHITGEDVARVVAFLLTPDAETISGTVIDVGCFAYQGGPIPKP